MANQISINLVMGWPQWVIAIWWIAIIAWLLFFPSKLSIGERLGTIARFATWLVLLWAGGFFG